MIFSSISRSLALQFTGFVFMLFLVNGIIFFAADLENARRQMEFRLIRDAEQIVQILNENLALPKLAPRTRQRVRILTPDGNVLFAGNAFEDVPVSQPDGFSLARIENDELVVFSRPVPDRRGRTLGYLQITEPGRLPIGDLPLRAVLYLIVSVVISLLTYFVGRYFAWRSLKPAEEMFLRLEQFTQDASHELRTPLAVLGSSLDVALKTNQYREGLVSAKEDLKQIGGLVERLLDFAKLGDGALKKKTVHLSSLVTGLVNNFKALAEEKGIAIEAVIEENIFVEADEAMIRQVLGNLLSNAIKFTATGTISVKLSENKLALTDTGIGIAKKDLPHIFNRFYQADSSRSNAGYGLGLALAKRILDMHGWTINVKSSEKVGTEFTIAFPKP